MPDSQPFSNVDGRVDGQVPSPDGQVSTTVAVQLTLNVTLKGADDRDKLRVFVEELRAPQHPG